VWFHQENIDFRGNPIIKKYSHYVSVIVAVAALLFPADPALATNAEQTDRIITNIMNGYKMDIHPKANDNGSIVVKINLVPLHLSVVRSSVSTGKPFCHSRESGNANSISREFPGSRELIFT
jgi:hypothetical protein